MESKNEVMAEEVSQCLSRIDSDTTHVNFPSISQETNKSLSAECYQDFFIGLQSRLNELAIDLQQVTLNATTEAALQGLKAYDTSAGRMRFSNLEFILDPGINSNPAAFLTQLLEVLPHLEKNELSSMTIEENDASTGLISEAQWNQLLDYVKKNEISVSILLPTAYRKSETQRRLDEVVSINQRQKNIHDFERSEPNLVLKPTISPEKKKKKKTKKVSTKLISSMESEVEMQQEQQVETTIANEYTLEGDDDSSRRFAGIRGLDLYTVKNKLLDWLQVGVDAGNGLSAEASLITEAQLEKKWYTWLGNIVQVMDQEANYSDALDYSQTTDELRKANFYINVFHHPTIKTISEAAVLKLLNHQVLFQDGLQFDNLPKGFLLVPDRMSWDNLILHYSKEAESKETIAPLLKDRTSSTRALPADVFNAILEQLRLRNKRYKVILDQWTKLSEGAYVRENVLRFRRLLPTFLHFNEKHLTLLFNLLGEPPQYRYLDYFLESYRVLGEIFQGKVLSTPTDKDYAWRSFCQHGEALLGKAHFGEKCQSILTLAHELSKRSLNKDAPMVFTLLTDNPELLLQLQSLDKTEPFSPQQADALLEVYAHYGDKGLIKLLNLWRSLDTEVFAHLQQTLFKESATFLPMIVDDRFEKAFATINGLKANPAQYQWWQKLLTQHMEAVGDDDLPALVEAFTAFSKKIAEYELTFYPEVGFKGVKSLPTVLARMLSILSQCKPEDRVAQWQCITDIPLTSTSAIRAFIDSPLGDAGRCRFVVPLMATTTANYNELCLYDSKMQWGYNACAKPMHIIKRDGFEIADIQVQRKRFYRFIAHQTFRLPLAFYQEMDKAIQESSLSENEQTYLYGILAACTTGEYNIEKSADPKTAALQWKAILKQIKAFTVPLLLKVGQSLLREDAVQSLAYFQLLPPLAELASFVSLVMTAQYAGGVEASQQKMKEFQQRMRKDQNLIFERYGNGMYQGMKFYDPKAYTEDSLYHHMDVVRILALGQPCEGITKERHYLNNEGGKALLSLISHFGLSNVPDTEMIAVLTALRQAYLKVGSDSSSSPREREKEYSYINQALMLLSSMDNNKGLKPSDLITFIYDFTQEFISTHKAINRVIVKSGVQH